MTLLDSIRDLRLRIRGGLRRHMSTPQHASKSKILTPNPSLLRKLAVPVIGIAIQALVATASLQTLSILRVFIQCESQWSKS